MEPVTGYAKHGNVNPVVDSGNPVVDAGYAKHGNVNPVVDSGNPVVDSGYAKHGNVNPVVDFGNPEVNSERTETATKQFSTPVKSKVKS